MGHGTVEHRPGTDLDHYWCTSILHSHISTFRVVGLAWLEASNFFWWLVTSFYYSQVSCFHTSFVLLHKQVSLLCLIWPPVSLLSTTFYRIFMLLLSLHPQRKRVNSFSCLTLLAVPADCMQVSCLAQAVATVQCGQPSVRWVICTAGHSLAHVGRGQMQLPRVSSTLLGWFSSCGSPDVARCDSE